MHRLARTGNLYKIIKNNKNIKNLPFLSQICFSTLQFIFGFMRIMVPLLWFVPWLKNTSPPLKTVRRFGALFKPLLFTDMHFDIYIWSIHEELLDISR